MKATYIVFVYILLFVTSLISCGELLEPYNELESLTDYYDYNKIEGTYLFQPNDFQANKLGVHAGDSVILTIFGGRRIRSHNTSFVKGNYSINKMILVLHQNSNKPYSSEWLFSSRENTNIKHQFVSSISFLQDLKKPNNISFNLEKRPSSDTLHIVGNTSDPEFVAIQIIDFKKIK